MPAGHLPMISFNDKVRTRLEKTMNSMRFDELPRKHQELLGAAAEAMETAYSPYSGFCVGTALRCQDGTIVTASNVENAAYGSTICAERMALGRANAQGKRRFRAVAVIARGRDFPTREVTSPCGACRQMLFEAAQLSEVDLEIVMATTNQDKIVVATIGELLPLGFGPDDLGVDIGRYR